MLKFAALRFARHFGFDITRYTPAHDPHRRMAHAMQRQNIKTLLDVGANVGQFGQMIRLAGYNGRLVSFEPLLSAHATLEREAAKDASWVVAPRCAISDRQTMIEIQVAGNLQSSSALMMLDRHIQGDPKSRYVGSESVGTISLDAYLDEQRSLPSPFAVKIDTQGYESVVLNGLMRWIEQVAVIRAEMSLVPLYEGTPSFRELFATIEGLGFHCVSLEPNFIDPRTYEVLQVDAVFERNART